MQCWETHIGQEMYKLTLFDLLINMAVLVLVEFPRRYRRRCHHEQHHIWSECSAWLSCCCFIDLRILVDNVSNKLVQSFGRQEFVVPSNVLGLVYAQTVVWMGALFCPLLPLINIAKFIILFYIKKVSDSSHISNLHGRDIFPQLILIHLVLNTSSLDHTL